jgi:hypothetical protein
VIAVESTETIRTRGDDNTVARREDVRNHDGGITMVAISRGPSTDPLGSEKIEPEAKVERRGAP